MLVWRFYMMDDAAKAEARRLFDAGEYVELMVHYNANRVSPKYLSPCCDLNDTVELTAEAIRAGKLGGDE